MTDEQIIQLKEEKEHLEYVLMAVMHSVDKWLEGDELKQDEANRACTMREKTLKITEKLHKKIDGLQKANQESFIAIEKRKGEIERLNTSNNALRKSNEKMFVTISKQDAEIERLKAEIRNTDNTLASLDRPLIEVKSEAYKEFAHLIKKELSYIPHLSLTGEKVIDVDDIDTFLKELTEGGNEDGMD